MSWRLCVTPPWFNKNEFPLGEECVRSDMKPPSRRYCLKTQWRHVLRLILPIILIRMAILLLLQIIHSVRVMTGLSRRSLYFPHPHSVIITQIILIIRSRRKWNTFTSQWTVSGTSRVLHVRTILYPTQLWDPGPTHSVNMCQAHSLIRYCRNSNNYFFFTLYFYQLNSSFNSPDSGNLIQINNT